MAMDERKVGTSWLSIERNEVSLNKSILLKKLLIMILYYLPLCFFTRI
jgi:hypothetical protein